MWCYTLFFQVLPSTCISRDIRRHKGFQYDWCICSNLESEHLKRFQLFFIIVKFLRRHTKQRFHNAMPFIIFGFKWTSFLYIHFSMQSIVTRFDTRFNLKIFLRNNQGSLLSPCYINCQIIHLKPTLKLLNQVFCKGKTNLFHWPDPTKN